MDPTGTEMPIVTKTPHPAFPPRMFAIGEEPFGIRVTSYHKPSCISKILNSLEPEEIEIVKASPFGKLVKMAEQPPFSCRFGCFLIFIQLKVSKKHEVWFLFAGKPLWFSIREFTLVTGLNCCELFGSMKDVHVSYVITMRKQKTVSDSHIRIKYALLALLSSVILPTSHSPCISQDCAEKIKDIDQFLAYPWGQVSFEMLTEQHKRSNVASLSQNTVALKGFVLSIQLVMIEVVPSLIGVVTSRTMTTNGVLIDRVRKVLTMSVSEKSTQLARFLSPTVGACAFHNLYCVKQTNVNPDLCWSDDEEDVLVDNLVNYIQEGFSFCSSHFTGGVSKSDVILMHEDSKKENLFRKTAKTKLKQLVSNSVYAEYVAFLVKKKNLGMSFTNSHNLLCTNIQTMLKKLRGDIRKMITTPCMRPHLSLVYHSQPDNPGSSSNAAGETLDTDLGFSNPTFSLGLTQEDPLLTKSDVPDVDNVDQAMEEDAPVPATVDDAPVLANRKSKQEKVVHRKLVGEYQCDMRLPTRVLEAHINANRRSPNIDYCVKFGVLSLKLQSPFIFKFRGLSIDNKDLSVIVDRSSHLSDKFVDALIHHTRYVFQSNFEHIHLKNYVFLDTKFVSLLAKTFANVGVCVNISLSQVIVLDCNNALRTDGMITKELCPFSNMLPYLLRQAGKQLCAKDLKSLTIERPRSVPQNHNKFDYGITAILLIQAHAVGGVDVCKCITPNVLDAEVERTVMIHEEYLGVL
ncbi:hypothetical protein N665_0383s0021 [Sinapis alba]|nr:hypothetical protein N665_0383s0021 [Sinapis alba]